MSLRFAVIGKTGQLARALKHLIDISDHQAIFFDRKAFDLSRDPELIKADILKLPDTIDAVVIAAAYTAVDKAESEYDLAFAVNASAPGAIAQACVAKNFFLIHISTDYVFYGDAAQPYQPDAPTNPINAYGASKLAGEKAVINAKCRGVILRTSWVFDGYGQNFLNTMLRLAQTRTGLNVVNDQLGRPTYAGHLAEAILKAAEKIRENHITKLSRHHVTGSGSVISWNDFATAIFKHSSEQIPHAVSVIPIPTKNFPTPAKRPRYSVLDISSYENTFSHKLPSWEVGLKSALNDKYN